MPDREVINLPTALSKELVYELYAAENEQIVKIAAWYKGETEGEA